LLNLQVTLPGISREFIIEDLRKYTEYRIWILAFTEVGDGPPSYVINVRTEEDGKNFYLFY